MPIFLRRLLGAADYLDHFRILSTETDFSTGSWNHAIEESTPCGTPSNLLACVHPHRLRARPCAAPCGSSTAMCSWTSATRRAACSYSTVVASTYVNAIQTTRPAPRFCGTSLPRPSSPCELWEADKVVSDEVFRGEFREESLDNAGSHPSLPYLLVIVLFAVRTLPPHHLYMQLVSVSSSTVICHASSFRPLSPMFPSPTTRHTTLPITPLTLFIRLRLLSTHLFRGSSLLPLPPSDLLLPALPYDHKLTSRLASPSQNVVKIMRSSQPYARPSSRRHSDSHCTPAFMAAVARSGIQVAPEVGGHGCFEVVVDAYNGLRSGMVKIVLGVR
ncbi:hypothetical protein Hypma_010418 [Hypsizygus marmoreus]|uniref:Uncharacterized protein n=1 Tax=Hypsizygus marmoreus TaxID=39966 RepID=A0A369JSV1_HYPMA|nr:hypothetical protein Hypma_010418 [Hypsizygus marmoreus]